MADVVQRCSTCGAHALVSKTKGRLVAHNVPSTGERCRGGGIARTRPEEYTVGFDTDPWVYGGGLPERNRRKF